MSANWNIQRIGSRFSAWNDTIARSATSPGSCDDAADAGPSAKRAFTLVELLVVIGIIAMLISMLLPALQRARLAAKSVQCMSNMKQLSAGLLGYANENKGYLPVQTNPNVGDFGQEANYDSRDPNLANMLTSVMPYVGGYENAKKLWLCSEATKSSWSGFSGDDASASNYMANAAVAGHALGRITSSSEVIWLQEDRFEWNIAWLRPVANGGTPPVYSAWCFDNGPPWGQEYSNLHNLAGTAGGNQGGGNLAFVDGHVEFRYHTTLHPSDFGLVGIPGSSNSNDPNTVSQGVPYYGAFD